MKKKFFAKEFNHDETGTQKRREKKNYEKDFAVFCKIMKQYFPKFTEWMRELKDPRKFWTYEIEVMLMTVIMKNICSICSMQKMTDEFLKEECVGNLCRVLGVEPHELLPHYVTLNKFLARLGQSQSRPIKIRPFPVRHF